MVATTRTVIAASELRALVAAHYDLGADLKCSLRSAEGNDTYLVTTSEDRFVLRVYRHGRPWITRKTDHLFELEWLRFLNGEGVSVSYPVPRRDGSLVNNIEAPEGTRYWAVFTFAEGVLVDPPTVEIAHRLGELVAKIHLVSDGFTPSHGRFKTDLNFLITDPLGAIRRVVGDGPELDFLTDLGGKLVERIAAAGIGDGGWGVIGGDFNGGNHHVDGSRLTFFDFDLCSYGWRAYDLAVLVHNARLGGMSVDVVEPYLNAYRGVRRLSRAEEDSLDLFVMARRIMRLGHRALEVDFTGDVWRVNGYWESALHTLRAWATTASL